jgi:excisionase family DNA binding protein
MQKRDRANSGLPPPPLTVREVAGYLGVGDDVVRSLINKKKLKAIKVEGQWSIFRADLAEYIMSKIERA